MNDLNQLEVIKPAELNRIATDVAGVCKDIVVRTACQIQGRKYVKVEGWQSIATAHGCVASCRDVEKVDGGFRAIGEIKRISDGQVLATAEGFVGEDEPTWFGGPSPTRSEPNRVLTKRADYAIRAMAQTRAISRVCRSAFAHVVVLMDAGLSTTPAEEVPEGGFTDVEATTSHSEPSRRGLQRAEVMFDDYKRVDSKPGAAKDWTAWFCKFTDDSGLTLEMGTFDGKIAENLDTLKGQAVEITYRPGKKPNTLELCTINPIDNIP